MTLKPIEAVPSMYTIIKLNGKYISHCGTSFLRRNDIISLLNERSENLTVRISRRYLYGRNYKGRSPSLDPILTPSDDVIALDHRRHPHIGSALRLISSVNAHDPPVCSYKNFHTLRDLGG